MQLDAHYDSIFRKTAILARGPEALTGEVVLTLMSDSEVMTETVRRVAMVDAGIGNSHAYAAVHHLASDLTAWQRGLVAVLGEPTQERIDILKGLFEHVTDCKRHAREQLVSWLDDP
ncbi:hypothetical protein EFK50_07610 [Nocardioides marmoriginsengisoli]|uniref:Uncharacterized protein n=1 Tax=Nocardioides marmoriginsengisoli TaxID=661483 RepID=A0A3N0CLS0_9ACTN|nr:hypothetical protein EFK50_07610 [Nocardioides marmoriginsengisoli]